MKNFTPTTLVILLVLYFINVNLNAQDKKPVEREWTSFVQSIDISTDKPRKFKLTAAAKVVSNNISAKSGLWARVDNKKKKVGFFDNMNDRPITDANWRTYTIEGDFDKKAEKLVFGGLMFNDGAFYFDDFKLQIEDDKGILQEVALTNASFEKLNGSNVPSDWYLGISQGEDTQIKGFNVKQTNDATEGSTSLLFVGTNISPNKDTIIDIEDGYTPQIGTLVSMLNSLKQRVEQSVRNLSVYETDYLMDDEANRIGALIYHLAATEKVYQIATFERRDLTTEEDYYGRQQWSLMGLVEKNFKENLFNII